MARRKGKIAAALIALWLVAFIIAKNFHYYTEELISADSIFSMKEIGAIVFTQLFFFFLFFLFLNQLDKKTNILNYWDAIRHEKYFLLVFGLVLFFPFKYGFEGLKELVFFEMSIKGVLMGFTLFLGVLGISIVHQFVVSTIVAMFIKSFLAANVHGKSVYNDHIRTGESNPIRSAEHDESEES